MDAQYIYAGTLAKTKEQELLTDTQLEMLLSAKSVEDFFVALQDTYLSSYIVGDTNHQISQALEESVTDAKKLLTEVAPKPELLNILWIKYDFYNLRTIIKSGRAGLSKEKTLSMCFSVGLYDPETLFDAYAGNSLSTINQSLKEASGQASQQERASDIDSVIHEHYFERIKEMARKSGEPFVKKFVLFLIDVFNIVTRLRIISLFKENENVRDIFVEGGSFSRSELEDETQLSASFNRIGGSQIWDEAMGDYQKTGNFSLIEKAVDEAVIDFLDRESFELFSLAPLYAYFTATKNNAQIIRAIYVGKVAGLSEHDIRFSLRKLYR